MATKGNITYITTGNSGTDCLYLISVKIQNRPFVLEIGNYRGDSMIFTISWAADPGRSRTVWFRSGMVPSCHINYQKFGEFMFG